MLAFGFISFQSLQKAWMKIGWKEVKLRYSNKTEPGKKRELSMGFFCSDSIDWTSTLEQNALGFWEVSYPMWTGVVPSCLWYLQLQGCIIRFMNSASKFS